jgi:hypothetical protein
MQGGMMVLRYCALMTGILGLLLFSLPDTSHGGQTGGKRYENEIFAIGTALMKEGNEAAAREEAISQALAKGVEQYLVQRLGHDDLAGNFSRFMDEVLTGSREGVGNFNIVAEDLVDNKYRIFVRIKINEKVLEKKMRKAGVLGGMEGPSLKVLFLVAEVKEGGSLYWWGNPEVPSSMNASELFFINKFREGGFATINRSQGVPAQGGMEELTSINLSDESVIRWGKLLVADIAVYGETRIINEEIISLRLKAFNIRDGNLIFQTVEAEPVEEGKDKERAIKTSIEKLVNDVAEVLFPIIHRSAISGKGESSKIMITLNGLHSYRQYRMFRDFLTKEISGVKSVKQVKVRSNAMSIAVEFQGERNELLDRMLNHENIPFPITLEYSSGGEVILNVE